MKSLILFGLIDHIRKKINIKYRMIENKHIEWYFNHMKLKGIISEGWEYSGFNETDDSIIIRYYHNTKQNTNRFSNVDFQQTNRKNSSYAFPKERVIEELRESKLKRLLD